jgi:hypothetical protein
MHAFCNITYSTSSSPSTYIVIVYGETLARRGLPPSIFQSVIACVPTGWSHLSDTPISIYYGHMIALEGVAHTRQSLHVAQTCVLGERAGVPARAFVVRAGARRMAKRHRGRTAKMHGTAAQPAWQRGSARQSTDARQCFGRTAKKQDARQRSTGTAKPLPSIRGETHGKVCIAGHGIAVWPLPCVDARQCRCRVFSGHCRATCPHGKVLLSSSASSPPSTA